MTSKTQKEIVWKCAYCSYKSTSMFSRDNHRKQHKSYWNDLIESEKRLMNRDFIIEELSKLKEWYVKK